MIKASIEITDNADWAIPLIFNDDVTGAPWDFTDDEFKMEVRPSADSATLSLTLSTANGRIDSTSPENGYLTLIVPKGMLAAGAYVYDLIRLTGAAQEYLIGGQLTVLDGVTA